jgi:poly(beta-D-mannuronate) lyase
MPAALFLAFTLLFVTHQHTGAQTIDNPGFEAGWKGWRIAASALDETAISEVAMAGRKSAKITGPGGHFEQCIEVSPETDYLLKAFIRGRGRMGAVIGAETMATEAPGDGKDWVPVVLSINSKTKQEISIFGAFSGGDVRFDDFSIVKTDQRSTSKEKGERIVSVALNHADEMKAKDCGADRASDSIVDHRDIKTGNIGPYGLRTDVPPSENFDLADWKLTLPVDRDHDGKADEVSETDLAQGWSDPSFFYTDPVTGGLVFRVPQNASATTIESGYPRTELREMLRAGDLSIDTRRTDGKANKNNWVLPSAPEIARAQAGGVGGVLRATLAVNQVTRMGEPHRIGRVVIGQIHARDHEVLRLYYRKLPTNSLGSIYYAHDLDDDSEIYVEIIGDRGDFIPNPKEGIALDEVFSYEVRLEASAAGERPRSILHVDIIRNNGMRWAARPLDLTGSIYTREKEFLYFKAGAYSQNAGIVGQGHDGDQVTFYKLENSHDTQSR